MKKRNQSRREFLSNSVKASAIFAFPTIVPASVFGKNAPSNRINVAAIGTGRISRGHDIPGVWQYDYAQLMAVCDLDSNRAEEGRKLVNDYYTKRDGKPFDGVKAYTDYRELLVNKDIDAVLISTPDHTHAMIGAAAARAKKHIYMQKPASLTIAEGRVISDVVTKSGVKFQIGSQQRSTEQFRYAAELVRNGRIGQLKTVYVGLPGDPPGGNKTEMPVPKNLNYDMWLASTPEVYYTVDRVHPQSGYDRPGWLRCEQFGAGMITGWGAHHIDIAHWGLGMEHSGLSHLSDLPFDSLKIDRSFVSRMTEDRGHAALFQAIISMIHSLGMTAVAEGVEAPSQLIYLQAYGCDIIQGYLFGRPRPAEEFAPLLKAGVVMPSVDPGERAPTANVRASAA